MRVVDHREVLRVIADGGQVVDVLPDHEYRTAHVAGAIHLPLPQLLDRAESVLDQDKPIVVYCRDCLCDLSARAAAQLEFLGFPDVLHYLRGKADWMVRGLPCEPEPPLREKLRALPYFINNLAPWIRTSWIAISRRYTVGKTTKDDLSRLRSAEAVSGPALRSEVVAVVLNPDDLLLGAIERNGSGNGSVGAINPGAQTIRPDMTHRLAAELLKSHRYLLVTTAFGKYLGRYEPPTTSG